MKFGKYRVDSTWLSMIVGVGFVSLFAPFMWFSVLALVYFAYRRGAIEKD